MLQAQVRGKHEHELGIWLHCNRCASLVHVDRKCECLLLAPRLWGSGCGPQLSPVLPCPFSSILHARPWPLVRQDSLPIPPVCWRRPLSLPSGSTPLHVVLQLAPSDLRLLRDA